MTKNYHNENGLELRVGDTLRNGVFIRNFYVKNEFVFVRYLNHGDLNTYMEPWSLFVEKNKEHINFRTNFTPTTNTCGCGCKNE